MEAPRGFAWRYREHDTFLIREDVASALEPVLRAALDGEVPGARRLAGGRGTAVAVDLDGDLSAVVRRNRRGGAVAWLIDDLYFGWRQRPFEEIGSTERLRHAGVLVPEALGAVVRRVAGLWYRGAVATRWIPGAVTVWERLRQTPEASARRALCAAVLAAAQSLRAAGAVHPDLNLQNFLVAEDGSESRVWVIDCDGVRFIEPAGLHSAEHGVSAAGAARLEEAAIRRLERSARRLDPGCAIIDPTWFRQAADEGYAG